ncbi:MAG: hypothetical protein Q4G40_11980 [Brachybacterium sp.]|nr:hypothetical protein [Brachybacterium sp.]
MDHATVAVELTIGGQFIAAVDVPLTITAGPYGDGHVPLHADTDELTDRIRRGVAAFERAAQA